MGVADLIIIFASMHFPTVTLCLTAAVAVVAWPQRGQQQSRGAADWPCGARVDPSYFHMAEATGGHLFLLAPYEIADSTPLLLEVDRHPQTVFRLAGTITAGVHEFNVPIESSVASALFSISVQCLQNAEILTPSGTPVAGDGVADYSNFRAERMVIVASPETGNWKIRAGGSGIAGVMVQVRGSVVLSSVEFASAAGADFRPLPAAGVENVVRLRISGDVRDVQASVVNAAFRRIAALTLTAGEDDGVFTSRFTPGAEGFRVAVTGRDAQGLPFQRVDASLFIAR